MKVVALGKALGADDEGPVWAALRRSMPYADIVALRTPPGTAGVTLLRLLKLRPFLVIAEASGRGALPAALYRLLVPASRLLLCRPATEPRRPRWTARFASRRAHEVLDPTADVIERLRLRPVPTSAIFRSPPADLDLFAAVPLTRDAAALHRLIHVGPLSPESGAADLLVALASWAEQNPERTVEICWAGTGDLAGVFEAQPLPANLTQRFAGDLDRGALVDAFAAASIMVVPQTESKPPVIEALASGLVLIGNRRTPALRSIVGAGGPVWAFDAWGRRDLAAALDGALAAGSPTLDALRRAGRALACGARGELGLARGKLVSDGVFP